MGLARQAIAEHRPSLAVELVTEAVRENPDQKQARRMLGYVQLSRCVAHAVRSSPVEREQGLSRKVRLAAEVARRALRKGAALLSRTLDDIGRGRVATH